MTDKKTWLIVIIVGIIIASLLFFIDFPKQKNILISNLRFLPSYKFCKSLKDGKGWYCRTEKWDKPVDNKFCKEQGGRFTIFPSMVYCDYDHTKKRGWEHKVDYKRVPWPKLKK